LIQAGRLYYRGQDALSLAQQQSVEATAALIWLDRLDAGDLFARALTLTPTVTLTPALDAGKYPIAAYQMALARAATDDVAAYLTTPEAVAATGARILALLVTCTTGQPATLPLVHVLQRAWAPAQPDAASLLSAALILCADHELNVSAFTARSVASAGATPYDVVIAGLAALHGHRHGGHTARVAALLHAAAANLPGAVTGFLAHGEALPGFGHRLYPDGDPRAHLLLTLTAMHCPNAPVVQLAQALCVLVQQTLALHPTIDLALEVMAQALALPPAAALAIFALGRTIGWIGHASEQYANGQLIRPRARYTGRQAAI
jgi:citrate synthase